MTNTGKGAKNTFFGASVALAVLAASGAQAAIVEQWEVTIDATFVTNTIEWRFGSAGTTVSPTVLRWGTPSTTGGPQSGATITNTPTTGTVVTNGSPVGNIFVTHFNFPIVAGSPRPESFQIQSALTLKPLVPDLSGLPEVTQLFTIFFEETPNDANTCANGEPNNQGINSNGCGDIFVIDRDSLNFEFSYDTGDGINQKYFISFFELTSGLNPLPQAACDYVLEPDGQKCLGFVTAENAQTTVQFASRITTSPVSIPEPGTLALMGLGLGALGLLRRRKLHLA